MLNLIYGPSGSGKTERLAKQIVSDVQNGIRCYLLVPEQQAYISERDFSAILPSNAGLYFEVVHFSGLAEDLFRRFGGVVHASINQGMRSLLMWDTLRTLSPTLLQYGSSAACDSTLTALMLQTDAELRASGVMPDALDAIVRAMPAEHSLKRKLSDVAAITALYHQKIRDAYGEDPEDKIARMAAILQKQDYFKGARVYVDSFTSFTAQEYDVIKCLLSQAELVSVALCTDDIPSRLPHFESVSDTAKRLERVAAEAGAPVKKTRLFPAAGATHPDLAVLEHDLWRFQKLIDDSHEAPRKSESVRLLKCKNVYEEAEAAALNVLDLAQRGVPYGDISLIVRDAEAYGGILDAALERHSIPYFISERTDFSSKPLFRLILSALRIVCRNFPAQEVMTLVKTGLCGVDLRQASLFEEYCETWHINGSAFLEDDWSMNPDGLTTVRSDRAEEILSCANHVRRTVILPLERLRAELLASKTVLQKCEALYGYLLELNVQQQLAEIAKKDLAAKRTREASEATRLFRLLCQTLSELCRVLPDAALTNEEFATAISFLFSSTDMGSIPDTHDCVIIGSASTMRVERIRAALLLGLCEGEFPRAISDDGVLNDSEKEMLEEFDLILQSRQKARFSEELFYVYRAMTKASEHLILSTVSNDVDGSARTPSLAFHRARILLGLEVEGFDLKKATSAVKEEVTSAEIFSVQPMPSNTRLYLSQSKIKDFVLCPYRYYSTYQLKLRDKKDSRPSYADDGTFLHYVFERFLNEILDENGKLSFPTANQLEEITDAIIVSYLNEVSPFGVLKLNARLMHLYSRLRRLAVIMLQDMLSELQCSKFVPTYFEQTIGSSKQNGLPPVQIKLKNDSLVVMSGKIDRVDLYKTDEGIYVKVIDYKSGEHKFALKDVKTGMDIQLILYLHAFLSSNTQKYAAACATFLYTKTKNGAVQIERSGICLEDEEIKQALDSSPSLLYSKSLYKQTEQEIEGLIGQMLEAVRQTAEEIISGKADKTPSPDACKFCPAASSCNVAVKS